MGPQHALSTKPGVQGMGSKGPKSRGAASCTLRLQALLLQPRSESPGVGPSHPKGCLKHREVLRPSWFFGFVPRLLRPTCQVELFMPFYAYWHRVPVLKAVSRGRRGSVGNLFDLFIVACGATDLWVLRSAKSAAHRAQFKVLRVLRQALKRR